MTERVPVPTRATFWSRMTGLSKWQTAYLLKKDAM